MKTVNIPNRRLRSITTGMLHTEIGYLYRDMEKILGIPKGTVFTENLVHYIRLVRAHLKTCNLDERFWEKKMDLSNAGNTTIPVKDQTTN